MNSSRGFTMISMLIGMLLSILVVTGMMMAFRSTLQVIVPARLNAKSDGQRLSGMLSTSKLLQSAGFGLVSPAFGTDLVVLASATLTGNSLAGTSQTGSPATGNALIWGQDIGAGYTCNGLYWDASMGLQRLLPASCTAASQWGSINWSTETLIADDREVTIEIAQGACSPFGVAGTSANATGGTLNANVNTTMSSQDSTNLFAEIPVSLNICLANM